MADLGEQRSIELIPPGTILQDRYEIVKPLGVGGMGTVYEAVHTLIEKRVAIKCLRSEFARQQQVVERFHREALAATKIGHENIIDVVDLGQLEDDTVFMAMEYLEGMDLAGLIRQEGAQPIARIAHMMVQVCDALGAAHDKGVLHRDLKPDNIFVCTSRKDPFFVKILDFGVSKFLDAETTVEGQKTRLGAALGTPAYMSPEQIEGYPPVDYRSDIYALGVILFQAITGRLPFEERSFIKLAVQIGTEPPPSLAELAPDTPEAIVELCHKLLEKDREDRPQTCAEVMAALEPFAEGDRGPTPEPPPPVEIKGHYLQATKIDLSKKKAKGSGGAAEAVDPYSETVAGPTQKPSQLPLLAIGAAALLALAGVAWSEFGGGAETAEDEAEVAATAEGASPAAEPESPPDAAPAVERSEPTEPAATVRVQIQTTPASAELFLDGDRIGNPFDADLPQTTDPRRLEARLDGYRTLMQDLVLRYPQRLSLRLERGEGTDDRRRSARRPSQDGASSARSPRQEREARGAQGMRPAPPPPPSMAATPAPAMAPPPSMFKTIRISP